ncbi:hypothetical protein Tco_1149445 [Tanacetum coccineum]
MEHHTRNDAPIRSPTGIKASLGEHFTLIGCLDKIPIGDQDGFGAWYKSLQCHNHDFVEVALDIKHTGEEVAISEMEIVYKFESRAPVNRSSPSRLRT